MNTTTLPLPRHPGGRPRALGVAQVRYAKRAKAAGVPVAVIARTLHVGRATVHRALARLHG